MPQQPASRPMGDVCILQTRFGLKQYLWARWISPTNAQVHDGTRVVAEMSFTAYGSRNTKWIVRVFDLAQPDHSWRHNAREFNHGTAELAWTRMIREANKSWVAAHPDA